MHDECLSFDYVGQRWAELTKWTKNTLPFLDRPGITNEGGYYGLTMNILRQEGGGTGDPECGNDGQIVRDIREKVPVEPNSRTALAIGWTTKPARTAGPTGCIWYSNDVTMPKLPPPPRIPQNSSVFSS